METVKHIVSISLSSSKGRDKEFNLNKLGQWMRVSRIGTDGDVNKLLHLAQQWDGVADVIGLGGMDREVWVGNRRYVIKAADAIARHAKKTPVVDGSRVKRWVEPLIIEYLQRNDIIDFYKSNVLIVCAADRFGMAQAINERCPHVVYGDLMFSFGWPIPVKSYKALCLVGMAVLPIVRRLPLHRIYPLHNQSTIVPKYEEYYRQADVIAGDFHFIRKHLPPVSSGALVGKTIITNTVTPEDLELLKHRGVTRLVTPMEAFEGRFPATNVMEAILVTLIGKPLDEITEQDFMKVLIDLNWKPTITPLGGCCC